MKNKINEKTKSNKNICIIIQLIYNIFIFFNYGISSNFILVGLYYHIFGLCLDET